MGLVVSGTMCLYMDSGLFPQGRAVVSGAGTMLQ